MKKSLSNIIKAGILALSLYGNNYLYAEGMREQQKIEHNKININVQGTIEPDSELTSFVKPEFNKYEKGNAYELKNQLYSIIEHEEKISEVFHKLDKTMKFSEREKILALHYLQEELQKEYKKEKYDCSNISLDIEEIGKEIGVESYVNVGGINGKENHAFNIINAEKGLWITDAGGRLIFSESKNLEKILGEYYKQKKAISFQNKIYKDGEKIYSLINKDGKHFTEFIEYDTTNKTIQENLTNPQKLEEQDTINLFFGNYVNRIKIKNLFSLNTGLIKGCGNSSLEDMGIIQLRYDNKFSFRDSLILNLKGDISGIIGLTKEENQIAIGKGIEASLFTNREGLNLGIRYAPFDVQNFRGTNFFYFHPFEAGASFKIKKENLEIIPYLITTSNYQTINLSKEKEKGFELTNIMGGVNLSSKVKDWEILGDINYIYRNYENEIDVELKLKKGDITFSTTGYISKSNFVLCPDKTGISAKSSMRLGRFNLNVGGEFNSENYQGEKETNYKLFFGGSINFN